MALGPWSGHGLHVSCLLRAASLCVLNKLNFVSSIGRNEFEIFCKRYVEKHKDTLFLLTLFPLSPADSIENGALQAHEALFSP